MKKEIEIPILGDDYSVFRVLVKVTRSFTKPMSRILAVKISVNPSKFAVDEAYSIIVKDDAGREGEIGKILVIPRPDGINDLTIPENHTGAGALPALDPNGQIFEEFIEQVLAGLKEVSLVAAPRESHAEEPLGFHPLEKRDAP